MAEKPLVFISHITEEKELAIEFKNLVDSSLLGMLDVFVSSDENSIGMGQKWLDNITSSLENCAIEIVICSPQSIKRPWINFEAGAGWIRKIPVITLCHSGIKPVDLPIPLNLLQGANANKDDELKQILSALANVLGAKCPPVDFSDFVKKVNDFEAKYTLEKNVEITTNTTDSIHQLSNEAQVLLKEASITGFALYQRIQNETILNANYKDLITSKEPREVAKWQSAFEQLINKKLLQIRSEGGAVYEVTHLGFEIADNIRTE